MSDSDVMDIVPDDLANIIVPTALGVGAWQFYVLCMCEFDIEKPKVSS
jgi:hypothetical protein